MDKLTQNRERQRPEQTPFEENSGHVPVAAAPGFELNQRLFTNQLHQEFADITSRLRIILSATKPESLHAPPSVTLGENLLRSAAAIEQVFGGLTANLWDDPFEWTLPETLSTPELVLEYLDEVDATRARAFASIKDDANLLKYVASPSGQERTLFSMLLDALLLAHRFEDRAQLKLKMLSASGASGFII